MPIRLTRQAREMEQPDNPMTTRQQRRKALRLAATIVVFFFVGLVTQELIRRPSTPKAPSQAALDSLRWADSVLRHTPRRQRPPNPLPAPLEPGF